MTCLGDAHYREYCNVPRGLRATVSSASVIEDVCIIQARTTLKTIFFIHIWYSISMLLFGMIPKKELPPENLPYLKLATTKKPYKF
jgi:hypothetical protein